MYVCYTLKTSKLRRQTDSSMHSWDIYQYFRFIGNFPIYFFTANVFFSDTKDSNIFSRQKFDCGWDMHTHREILLNQTKIRLYLQRTDWFRTERTRPFDSKSIGAYNLISVWFDKNSKMFLYVHTNLVMDRLWVFRKPQLRFLLRLWYFWKPRLRF